MNIKINISEDKEFRDSVKALIREQVKSVTREDIRSIIEEILKVKLNGVISEQAVRQAFDKEIRQAIGQHLVGSWSTPSFLKTTARELIGTEVNKMFSGKFPLS